MKGAEQIVGLWTGRRKALAQVHAAGQLIKQVYNGDYSVSLPELQENEKAAVANLIQTGLDQHAMRIASTVPAIECPPDRNSRSAHARARDRKNTLSAWWYLNNLPSHGLRFRARHLIGYTMSPVYMRFGGKGFPVWDIKDPLCTFPGPSMRTDLVPPDCIFSMRISYRNLMNTYGIDAVKGLSVGNSRGDFDIDTMFDVLQYVDDQQISMVAVGKTSDFMGRGEATHVLLSTVPNLAGIPLVVVPGRITLDRLQGQFDQMIGMYAAQAKLWALQLHAIQKGVFAETWAQFADNMNGEIAVQADAYEGITGEIHGGTIQQFRPDPGFASLNAIDRLEASQRSTGSVPAEFGGEGASNVRTGRRGQQVMSAAVDMPIQEHQEILAASLQEENRIAIALAKAYAPNTPKTFNVPFARAPVTYTPSITFENEAQFVSYAYAGADINDLVIASGQRIGMRTMPRKRFMEIDPMIPDADAADDQMNVEALNDALLQGVLAQAQDPAGAWGPAQLARLIKMVGEKNIDLSDAIIKIQEEVQAEQAEAMQGQLPMEQMQPGLNALGAAGTAMGGEPIPEPPGAMANLQTLLSNLHFTSRTP